MKLPVLKCVLDDQLYRFTGTVDTAIEDNVVINEVINNINIEFFIGALSKTSKVSIC